MFKFGNEDNFGIPDRNDFILSCRSFLLLLFWLDITTSCLILFFLPLVVRRTSILWNKFYTLWYFCYLQNTFYRLHFLWLQHFSLAAFFCCVIFCCLCGLEFASFMCLQQIEVRFHLLAAILKLLKRASSLLWDTNISQKCSGEVRWNLAKVNHLSLVVLS